MTQYINLLNPALQARREPLSLTMLAITLAAVSIVLGGAHFYAKQRTASVQAAVLQAEAKLKENQDALVASGRALAAVQVDPRLVAELEAARTLLHARETALAELASGSLGDTGGFSEQFRAFARQSVAGLWLTGFSLSGSGTDIVIKGRALRAEQVPAYIRRLKDEPVFQGRSFASLRIEESRADRQEGQASASRPGAAPPFVEFRLTSSADPATGAERKALDAPGPGGKP